MNAPLITRHFAYIGERRVHYRRAGSGPAIVLLHQSPRSSAEHIALMARLAGRFTVIAPDTPGFGQSDPLGAPDDQPGIDAFVDALAALLEVLEIRQAGLYGTHSGAILAVRFAARYPARVSALAANGILLMTEAERSPLLSTYFDAFLPRWDGGHLAWLWSRLRDQLRFYPWFNRSAATRIDWPMTLEEIHENCIDLLAAGDHYRSGYRAVLDYPIELDLVRLAVPTRIIMARQDALWRYVERFPAMPATVELLPVDTFAEAEAAAETLLGANPAPAARASAVDAPPPTHKVASHFDTAAGAVLHVRRRGNGAGPATIILHEIGSSAASLDALIGAFDEGQLVLAPDLPWHGLSEGDGGTARIAGIVDRLAAWIEHTDGPPASLIALGDCAAIAADLARRLPDRISSLSLCDRPLDDGGPASLNLPPSLTPQIDGVHLFSLWSYLRDRSLAFPWHDRSGKAALAGAEPEAPLSLQRQLIDWLLAGERIRPLVEEVAAMSLAESLGELRLPVRSFATPGWPIVDAAPLPSRRPFWPPLLAAPV